MFSSTNGIIEMLWVFLWGFREVERGTAPAGRRLKELFIESQQRIPNGQKEVIPPKNLPPELFIKKRETIWRILSDVDLTQEKLYALRCFLGRCAVAEQPIDRFFRSAFLDTGFLTMATQRIPNTGSVPASTTAVLQKQQKNEDPRHARKNVTFLLKVGLFSERFDFFPSWSDEVLVKKWLFTRCPI